MQDLRSNVEALDDAAQISLDNGLTIIHLETHDHPVVSAQLWVRAGSATEGARLGSGISHALEHMLFKGTENRAPGKIDEEVQDIGGQMNAYTSFDHTVYWINAPSESAAAAIDILCDIGRNATLPADEWEKEREVIHREMDMCEDDPSRRSFRRFFETLYLRSPYREPVIGRKDVFDQITKADLEAYYRERYGPSNVFFVVVGDIDIDQIVDLIRSEWEGVPGRSVAPDLFPIEPPQLAPRWVVEGGPFQLAHAQLGWNVSNAKTEDIAGLDVLSTAMGAGKTSRLFRRLREETRLTHSIDSWLYNPGPIALFGVSAVLEGGLQEKARDEIRRVLDAIASDGVTEWETEKAIKQTLAAHLSSMRTAQGQAHELGGGWLLAGDLQYSQRFLEKTRLVTSETIKELVARALPRDHEVGYVLTPRDSLASTKTTRVARSTSAVAKTVLSNGLTLLTKREDRIPIIDVRYTFFGGALTETEKDNGVTRLMSRVLPKGTSSHSSSEIAAALEGVGGSIESYSGSNSMGLSLEFLAEDLPIALDMSAEVLSSPIFPEEEIEVERNSLLASIRAREDHPLRLASMALREALHGKRGYGLPTGGVESVVSALDRDALVRSYARFIRAGNGVVAVYGDVEHSRVVDALESRFSNWEGDRVKVPDANDPRIDSPVRLTRSTDKTQAVITMGFHGVSLFNPLAMAMEVLQEALNDMGSQLFTRVREDKGLAYFVGADNALGYWPGQFVFYAGTRPDAVGDVENEFLEEVDRLRTNGLTEAELKRAKAKIKGRKKLSRQDLGGEALVDALNELYGLGYEFSDRELERLDAVDIDVTREAAQQILDPNRRVVSIVSPDVSVDTRS